MNDAVQYRRHSVAHPELGNAPIPTYPSTSAAFFDREREVIFQRSWINVGRIEELSAPGDFMVKDLAVCRTSILLVHGKDGRIRGFHNVCKHRSNELVWPASGRCNGFLTCKFHGWVYDDQGRLRHVPDEDNFLDLNKTALGLSEVATDIWEGFIFVNLNPEQSLVEYLGEIPERLAGYPFQRFQTRFTYRAEERVNWKVLLDAQQEGCHVPSLHKHTLSLSYPKGLDRFRSKNFHMFGPHRMFSTGASEGFEPTAVGGVAARFGPTSIGAFAGAAASGGEAEVMEGIFEFWVVFPNFVLGLLYGTYFSYNIWPLAVDRSIWEIRMHYPQAQNAGQLFSNEYGKVVFRDPLLEDASTHERVQRGLMSGVVEAFQFQDEEIMARHGHQVVMDLVEAYDRQEHT